MLKELQRRQIEEQSIHVAHRELKALRLQAQFRSQVKERQEEKDEQRKRWRAYRYRA
jgi:hypothetical protein